MIKTTQTDREKFLLAMEKAAPVLCNPVTEPIVKAILKHFAEELAGDWVDILCCEDRSKILFSRYQFPVPPWLQPLVNFTKLYVHHFQTSDDDRALHDHPWDFHTLLLTGGYTEHYESAEGFARSAYRPQFSFLERPAEFRHRVELTDGPVWTLCFRSTRRREWGFWLPDELGEKTFVPWREYSKQWCEPDPNYHAHAERTRQREGREGRS